MRIPLRMVEPLKWIETLLLSKWAVHPASQSCPMESKEVLPRAGKRWAILAAVGICGRDSSAVWVEYIRTIRESYFEGHFGRSFVHIGGH